nr:acetylxylan esterase [uncultured Carboxylicivirga sp.]
MKNISFLIVLLNCVLCFGQNSPAPIKMIDMVLSPSHADWNYEVGEDAEVGVTVLKYGMRLKNVDISYKYGPELHSAEKKGKHTLKTGEDKINIGTLDTPGFKQLMVECTIDGTTYKNQVNLGFSVNEIKTTQVLPTDFVSFWNKSIDKARQVEFNAELKYLDDYSTEKVDVYLLCLNGGINKKKVYGYLCKPKKEGKYPVLFAPPGAGVKPITPYIGFAEQGYISLSIEIHGITPLLNKATYKQISSAFGDYMFKGLDSKEDYYYKGVYLACVRCIDYLCGLSDFDGKNVFITGGSQGGALAIVTAALNEKVTALVSFYPALCDLSGYAEGRAGGWPHMFRNKEEISSNRLQTTAYYDVVNFARMLKVPGFYSWGYNDRTCCPTSVYSAYNVISAPKEKHITPISGHWRFEETNQKSLEFLKSQIKEPKQA